jgi:hypothetical protein
MTVGWQPIATAPIDGTEIYVMISVAPQRAFWCGDLKRWVLSRPLSIDFANPTEWRPTGTALDRITQQELEKK